MSDLTERQREALDFIKSKEQRVSLASVRDICDHMGINSPNGVICHLRALEKKGYIKRIEGGKKGIRICESTPARPQSSEPEQPTPETPSGPIGDDLRTSPLNSANAAPTAAKQA